MSSPSVLYSLILTHSLLRLLDHLFCDSVVNPPGLAIHALADVSTSQQALIRCSGEERSLVEVGTGGSLCSSNAWHMHSHTPAAPMSDEVLPAHDTAEEPADHTDQIQVQAPYRNVGDLDATWLGSVSPCSSAGRDASPSFWSAWDRLGAHPSSP